MGQKCSKRATRTADPSTAKTTRPEALDRRLPVTHTASRSTKRKLDAMPDRIDIRDWPYRPTLAPLPPQIVSIEQVQKILDQGNEGAWTGFGLSDVINF